MDDELKGLFESLETPEEKIERLASEKEGAILESASPEVLAALGKTLTESEIIFGKKKELITDLFVEAFNSTIHNDAPEALKDSLKVFFIESASGIDVDKAFTKMSSIVSMNIAEINADNNLAESYISAARTQLEEGAYANFKRDCVIALTESEIPESKKLVEKAFCDLVEHYSTELGIEPASAKSTAIVCANMSVLVTRLVAESYSGFFKSSDHQKHFVSKYSSILEQPFV